MVNELREMNKEIRKTQEWIDILRAKATSMTKGYNTDRVQTSAGDTLGDIMCKIVCLEEELNRMIDTYADSKRGLEDRIDSMHNEEWQDILYMRCIEFRAFSEIALIKGCSLNAVKQKYKRAVKYLNKYTICSKKDLTDP